MQKHNNNTYMKGASYLTCLKLEILLNNTTPVLQIVIF